MEIRWHCYIFINCAFLIPCLLSKSFNLNKAIAAESQQHRNPVTATTYKPKPLDRAAERYSPFKLSSKLKRHNQTGVLLGNKLSPLKYRKAFQIRTPLKPKRVKITHKNRFKRRNLLKKRETNGKGKINHKYIPLLKSLSMLFDNLIESDYSESHENRRDIKYKAKYYSEDRNGTVCTCIRRYSEKSEANTEEKTTVVTAPTVTPIPQFDSENTEITTEATYNTAVSNFSSVRQNKNIPILLARNTSSTRRDNYGFSERGSPTFYRGAKRNISRDYGDSKYNSDVRFEKNESSTSHDQENSNGDSRHYANSDRSNTQIYGNRYSPRNTGSGHKINEIKESTSQQTTGHIPRSDIEFKRENNFEIGRHKTENPEFVPEFVRGLRRIVPENKIGVYTEPLHSKENHEESIIDVTVNSTSYKRVLNGNGEFTTKNKKVSKANEAMTSSIDFSNPKYAIENKQNKQVVMIIDGYSVARYKNGENKVAEKAIHVQS